jgi:hypothetical protein
MFICPDSSPCRRERLGPRGNQLYRPHRADAHAGPAAGASPLVEDGLRGSADPQPKPNRLLVAGLAAGATDHPAVDKASAADLRAQRPATVRLRVVQERLAAARTHAFGAKGAAAQIERDLRKSAAADANDLLGTGPHAVPAAVAAGEEHILTGRPRGPQYGAPSA